MLIFSTWILSFVAHSVACHVFCPLWSSSVVCWFFLIWRPCKHVLFASVFVRSCLLSGVFNIRSIHYHLVAEFDHRRGQEVSSLCSAFILGSPKSPMVLTKKKSAIEEPESISNLEFSPWIPTSANQESTFSHVPYEDHQFSKWDFSDQIHPSL